ncbi:MAG TPA: SUMF1/EgtB/PvdO family nonheme iron enzyme [Chitinispirillaceae bacterium]|nr:SUMF1/EgtB/PvdO family nonheme iron enzyme [Chitinispirillaceae bacterium]
MIGDKINTIGDNPTVQSLKIFLASSGTLAEERNAIDKLIAGENKRLIENGIFLNLVIWEELLKSFDPERIQNRFNEELLSCDVVIALFFDKVGLFTLEEFQIAYKAFKEVMKPRFVYVFFKKAQIDIDAVNPDEITKLRMLKRRIEKVEQIYCAYSSVEDLLIQLKQQLELILAVTTQADDDAIIKKGDIQYKPSKEKNIDISAYLNWIEQRCGQMDLQKLASEPIIVSLPELFVPLLTDDPDRSTRISLDSRRKPETREKEECIPVDIEELMRKNEYLLIEGDPGCGKSTLLKQIALKMKCQAGSDLFELPVLVFLRECIPFFKENNRFSAEEILNFYFNEHEGMLSCDAVKYYCKQNKALFLIDGLDEVPDDKRDRVIRTFAEFRNNHGVRMVLTGRKHGVIGEAMLWFGKKYVKIHPFNEKQIKLFVNRWCEHVFVKQPIEGRKSAEELCLELQSHEAVSALIENPLMLTTVCILYYEGEKLPEQRAELYRKFVENLVKRRFAESDRFLEVLKGFGFKMQESGEKGIGRNDALAIVKKTFRQLKDEDISDYNRRIAAIFDEFEPQCGLLRLEDGIYRFWHLTFQEYLAAEYLIATSEEPVKAIESFLTKDQYRETVRLYIGCLSLNQKNVATRIIRNVLQRQDASIEEILLVGEALVDIKKERRDELLTEELQQRYWEVINQDSIPRKRKAELGEIIGWIGDERDLMEFVKIEGGTYSFGFFNKHTMQPFSVSKYPVTNHWFAEFIKAGGYENKEFWSDEGWKFREENQISKPARWSERVWNCPNLPVVGVSWYEAVAFTEWLNASKFQGYSTYRLPAEQEWYTAAAGKDYRNFPWGNEFDLKKVNCYEGEDRIIKISPVGILSKGDTPEGVYDLAGNVWEWTSTEDGSRRVLRGGSWDNAAGYCQCASSNYFPPGLRNDYIGFRVVFLP